MEPAVIAAIITGSCAVTAASIGGLIANRRKKTAPKPVPEKECEATEGVRIKKWDNSLESQMIVDAKEELFLCGYDLSRLLTNRVELLAAADRLRCVRLLAMDLDDESVRRLFSDTFGRPPGLDSLKHLGCFFMKQNIKIRTVRSPLTHISAKDMNTTLGRIQVGFIGYKASGYQSPCMELTPADIEWYDFYREQMELIWESGTPWQPKGPP